MEEFVVIGTAENVEAEYSASSLYTAKFVLAIMYDGECIGIEGYDTKEAVIRAAKECEGCRIEYLF